MRGVAKVSVWNRTIEIGSQFLGCLKVPSIAKFLNDKALKHIGFKREYSSHLFAIPLFVIVQEDKLATLLSFKKWFAIMRYSLALA